MMERVSPPIRKFAAIGLLVAVVLAILNFIWEPVAHRIAHVEQEITAKRAMLGHHAALAQAAAEARAAGVQSEALLSRAVSLPGESEAVQLANLQSQLLGIAERESIRLQSSRTIAASQREGLHVIGLQMTLQTDMETLQGLIHRIQSHRPLLVVDALSITPARGVATEREGSERSLQIDLRVLTVVPTGNGGQP